MPEIVLTQLGSAFLRVCRFENCVGAVDSSYQINGLVLDFVLLHV